MLWFSICLRFLWLQILESITRTSCKCLSINQMAAGLRLAIYLNIHMNFFLISAPSVINSNSSAAAEGDYKSHGHKLEAGST